MRSSIIIVGNESKLNLLKNKNKINPFWQDKLIIEHFTKLADSLPVPIIIYNNPMTTSIDISLNTIELLANHPNICGIKDVTVRILFCFLMASPTNTFDVITTFLPFEQVAKLGCIVERTRGKNFQALAASVGYLLPSLLMGRLGSLCSK